MFTGDILIHEIECLRSLGVFLPVLPDNDLTLSERENKYRRLSFLVTELRNDFFSNGGLSEEVLSFIEG